MQGAREPQGGVEQYLGALLLEGDLAQGDRQAKTGFSAVEPHELREAVDLSVDRGDEAADVPVRPGLQVPPGDEELGELLHAVLVRELQDPGDRHEVLHRVADRRSRFVVHCPWTSSPTCLPMARCATPPISTPPSGIPPRSGVLATSLPLPAHSGHGG